MQNPVDLSQLAVRRDGATAAVAPPRRIVTRYLIPLGLLAGFAALVAWAAQDLYLPRVAVTVVPVQVSRAEVRRAGTPLFKAAAWVEPRPATIRVAALAPGVVEKLLVVEDQPVAAGEPVAYLVKADAELALKTALARQAQRQAELDQARAELAAAKTNLEQPVNLQAAVAEAKAALAKAETEIAGLPFDLKQAQAELRVAREEYKGRQASAEVIAPLELERSRSRLEAAQARLSFLEKRLEYYQEERAALAARYRAVQRKLELLAEEKRAHAEAQAKVAAAEANLEEARTTVAEARLRLERMTVRAPVAGRVLQLVAPPGAYVMPGRGQSEKDDAATVVTMYQPDRLQLRADVRFDDLPQVRPGQPVRIDSAAVPKPLSGKVLFLSSLANVQKNTLAVKVGIDDAPTLLKPDMLVDVTFLAPEPPTAPATAEQLRILVPKELIQSDAQGRFVWVADRAAGRAQRQPVETGAVTASGMVEVLRGLDPSSRLIASGRESVGDGSLIRIVKEESHHGAR